MIKKQRVVALLALLLTVGCGSIDGEDERTGPTGRFFGSQGQNQEQSQDQNANQRQQQPANPDQDYFYGNPGNFDSALEVATSTTDTTETDDESDSDDTEEELLSVLETMEALKTKMRRDCAQEVGILHELDAFIVKLEEIKVSHSGDQRGAYMAIRRSKEARKLFELVWKKRDEIHECFVKQQTSAENTALKAIWEKCVKVEELQQQGSGLNRSYHWGRRPKVIIILESEPMCQEQLAGAQELLTP